MRQASALDFSDVQHSGFFTGRLRQADGAVAEAIAAELDRQQNQIELIASGEAKRGVALCGSGIGISIAINRHPACRCALVSEGLSARLAREHNDCNVVAMGARLIGIEAARDIVDQFLATPFAADPDTRGRHQRRVDKLSNPVFARENA